MAAPARTYQGDVTLPVDGRDTAFRFEINVASEGALVLWLEDRASKKQWWSSEYAASSHADWTLMQSRALGLSDFVTQENVIPTATIAQYAELFSACLSDDTDGSTRLVRAKGTGGDRVLVLGVSLSSVPLTVTVQYEFPLVCVPLERVDLLGARMRDVEETLIDLSKRMDSNANADKKAAAGLEAKVDAMQKLIDQLIVRMDKPRRHTRATTMNNTAQNATAVWTVDSGMGISGISFGKDGRIRLNEPGLYALDFCFVHINSNNSLLAKIHIGNRVEKLTSSSYSGYTQTTTYHCVVKVEETKEEVHVVYHGNNNLTAGSHVSITEL